MTAQPMTERLDDTISYLQLSSDERDTDTALELVEGWQEELDGSDLPGADDLLEILGRLRAQLERDEPDPDLLAPALADLSTAVQDTADQVDEPEAGKLQVIADLLTDAAEHAVRSA